MKITKATRWRVFAGVWIQSLFTSATAFFSLFALPLTGQFGWSSSEFSMAYTIYMFVYCAMGFVGGLLAIVSWVVLVFGPSTAAWTAFTYTIIWGLSAGPSAQAFYSVWSPELFATPYRSAAQGIVFFAVRLASGLISLIFPIILAKENGLLIDGLILIGFLIIATLVGTVFAPKTRGKSLEEIEMERYGEHVTSM